MAELNGATTSVIYQTINLAQGGGVNNLLINPRGKINQAGESHGVLSAGQYFCDGWKAGDGGAEVYRDDDCFRLISGSIVQLVPNNVDVGQKLRANMDTISGAPLLNINGAGSTATADTAEYIKLEISGANSKFTRIILAATEDLPVYQQKADELSDCLRFYERIDVVDFAMGAALTSRWVSEHFVTKAKLPAVRRISNGSVTASTAGTRVGIIQKNLIMLNKGSTDSSIGIIGGAYEIDARP